jgi:hypothetical protein
VIHDLRRRLGRFVVLAGHPRIELRELAVRIVYPPYVKLVMRLPAVRLVDLGILLVDEKDVGLPAERRRALIA